jgi:hypothetical protein
MRDVTFITHPKRDMNDRSVHVSDMCSGDVLSCVSRTRRPLEMRAATPPLVLLDESELWSPGRAFTITHQHRSLLKSCPARTYLPALSHAAHVASSSCRRDISLYA